MKEPEPKCRCDLAAGECQGPLECKAVKCLPALVTALEDATHQLRDLLAMCEGEVPSLLEDHHSYPKIIDALESSDAALAAYREALK